MSLPPPVRHSGMNTALMIAAGALWIALTGACTVFVEQQGLRGTWPIGAYLSAQGLFPVLFGWRRLEPRLARRRLLAAGVALVAFALTGVLAAAIVLAGGAGVAALLVLSPLIAINLALAWIGVRGAREPRRDPAKVFS